jgi:hypothetical protein
VPLVLLCITLAVVVDTEQMAVQVAVAVVVAAGQKVAVQAVQEHLILAAAAEVVAGLVVAVQVVQVLWSFVIPVHSAVQAAL